MMNELFCLQEEDNFVLAKYTFSDAIAASVKLGVWEASLGKQPGVRIVHFNHTTLKIILSQWT